jgi:hypothetical protein
MRLTTAAATAVVAIFALVANTAPMRAQPADAKPADTKPAEMETLTDKEVPAAVASRLKCKQPSGTMTRQPFSGGFVFSQTCADGAEPLVRVVFATSRDGANARILQFHRPEGRRMSALATVAFLPADNEISGTTGRLTRLICRAEGRWRMEGKQPAPGLVYWRQTRDCEGKTGWRTVTGRAR